MTVERLNVTSLQADYDGCGVVTGQENWTGSFLVCNHSMPCPIHPGRRDLMAALEESLEPIKAKLDGQEGGGSDVRS